MGQLYLSTSKTAGRLSRHSIFAPLMFSVWYDSGCTTMFLAKPSGRGAAKAAVLFMDIRYLDYLLGRAAFFLTAILDYRVQIFNRLIE